MTSHNKKQTKRTGFFVGLAEQLKLLIPECNIYNMSPYKERKVFYDIDVHILQLFVLMK